MDDANCGLLADGKWGDIHILFPGALVEFKPQPSMARKAEDEVYKPSMIALAMLDKLVRNPNNMAKYQTKESWRFQVFAFTACGPIWRLYSARKGRDAGVSSLSYVSWCHLLILTSMETASWEQIWEGDVRMTTSAFELLYLVDQIHNYIVNDHRRFVVRHLKAWYARHKALSRTTGDTAEQPEWFRLKKHSDMLRYRKGLATRERNRQAKTKKKTV